MIPPAPFFFLKTALAICDLLCFYINCEFFCFTYVKNAVGNLIGIALNLYIALGNMHTEKQMKRCLQIGKDRRHKEKGVAKDKMVR